MFLAKKLKNNKTIILITCVIVACLVYLAIQKVIDNYNLKANNDIISSDEHDVDNEIDSDNKVGTSNDSAGGKEKTESESEETPSNVDCKISSEETDLILEDTEESGVSTNDALNGEKLKGSDSGENKNDSEKDNTRGEDSAQSKIYVYVTGEVNNPGVVTLNEGSRIVDAINSAGGTTPHANISKVNLVFVLEDGMKVNIPNDNDLKNNQDFEYITMNSGDGRNDNYYIENSFSSSRFFFQ